MKIKFKLSILQNLVKQVAKIKKIPWVLAEHVFLTFLIFFFFVLILGGFIFYKYSILMEKEEPEVLGKVFQFEEKVYQEVLKEWQKREKRFNETLEKEYSDPFREIEKETPANSIPEINHNEKEPYEKELSIHFVLEGETLWEIAERYLGSGERWKEITDENDNTFSTYTAEVLQPGQKLIIPPE